MLKITATVNDAEPRKRELASRLRAGGLTALSEDEHIQLLELEREWSGEAHGRWAAGRLTGYLRDVVHDGGMFGRGGNSFTHTACVPEWKPRLNAAVELAASSAWVTAQFRTLRVKPKHMDAARAHLVTLVVKLIEREVADGF